MARHWSERLSCSCGASFRSVSAEAKHRHNFPLLCKKVKPKGDKRETSDDRKNNR